MRLRKESDISEQYLIKYPSVSVSTTAYFSVLCCSRLRRKLFFFLCYLEITFSNAIARKESDKKGRAFFSTVYFSL